MDAPKPDWSWCIPLRALDGHVRAWTMVSEEDFERFGELRCCLNPRGYALVMLPGMGRRGPGVKGAGRQAYLHREVMGMVAGDGRAVDHISGDKLDNRRSNLRECTQGENMQNKRGYGRTSAHRGVTYDKGRAKWVGMCTVGGQVVLRKRFDTELEAAQAAAEARRLHMTHATG